MHKQPYPYREKTVTFYLEPEQVAIIKTEMERTGENRSELMRRILNEWAAHQPSDNEKQVADFLDANGTPYFIQGKWQNETPG